MRYLYAVLDAGACTPDLPGIGGAPVDAVRYADLQALTSEVPSSVVAHPDGDALWAHETVVEAAAEACEGVLPMRFGSVVRDVPRVVALLAGRHAELAQSLDRVRGAVELGVRVVAHGSASGPYGSDGAERPDPGGGAAWLRARADALHRTDGLALDVHAPLAALATASRRASMTVAPTVLAAAYLVPRPLLPDFREAVTRLAGALTEATVTCTGPWPVYSFTSTEGIDPDAGSARTSALAS